ncbi:hypothetical protein ACQJBY_063739 [Aegilops geniculata]
MNFFDFPKIPSLSPTRASRSRPLKPVALTLSFPSHPPPLSSPPDPSSPASPRRCRRPLLAVVAGLSSPSPSHPASSLSPHHRATPFPPTARNPPPVGQKFDLLGADDELLGGGGTASACADVYDEATWIRAGCCWRTSGSGWT